MSSQNSCTQFSNKKKLFNEFKKGMYYAKCKNQLTNTAQYFAN